MADDELEPGEIDFLTAKLRTLMERPEYRQDVDTTQELERAIEHLAFIRENVVARLVRHT